MPAAASAARMLRVDVSKNFITAASSHDGAFDTSTTTAAPFSASASPSPVRVLTPVAGDAAMASCPCSRSLLTSFDPMSPVPPITTIFIVSPFARLDEFEDVGLHHVYTEWMNKMGSSMPLLSNIPNEILISGRPGHVRCDFNCLSV